MGTARYDDIAEFYAANWPDEYDDPASVALLDLVGPVRGLSVLDVACGHGRLTRELARRGARVVGADISAEQVAAAKHAEERSPLGVTYVQRDIARSCSPSEGMADSPFDLVTCHFGLSDVDDLRGALSATADSLRTGGAFVFSILHPCFPGGREVSGSWPSEGTYFDERWWRAEGAVSSLRRRVGANHRTVSGYVNALVENGLLPEKMAEPPPAPTWVDARDPDLSRYPFVLVMRCAKA